MPCAWQGWVVLVGSIALALAGVVFLMPDHPRLFIGQIAVIIVAVCIVCLLKGEKPRWRWGNSRP